MVTAEHTPMSEAERVLLNRFFREIMLMIKGRSLVEQVELLCAINRNMELVRVEQAARAAEQVTVH